MNNFKSITKDKIYKLISSILQKAIYNMYHIILFKQNDDIKIIFKTLISCYVFPFPRIERSKTVCKAR